MKASLESSVLSKQEGFQCTLPSSLLLPSVCYWLELGFNGHGAFSWEVSGDLAPGARGGHAALLNQLTTNCNLAEGSAYWLLCYHRWSHLKSLKHFSLNSTGLNSALSRHLPFFSLHFFFFFLELATHEREWETYYRLVMCLWESWSASSMSSGVKLWFMLHCISIYLCRVEQERALPRSYGKLSMASLWSESPVA